MPNPSSRAKLWMPVLLGCVLATAAIAQVAPAPPSASAAGGFRATEAFTFLFLSIGPAHAIAAFAGLTAGRDAAFKRRLAFYGTGAAALAILLAATIGVSFLAKWGVSLPALALAAGLLLLLVALGKLLGPAAHPDPPAVDGPRPRAIDLAFSPLATPLMIPPFGMAIVVLLMALAQQRGAVLTVAALVAVILTLDLLAMLFADRILKLSALRYGLGLVSTILGVLQVALAVQTIANAVRELNVF